MRDIRATSKYSATVAQARHIVIGSTSLAITQIAQMLIPIADVTMIGWLGTRSLAASSLVGSVGILLYLTSFGILQGLIPVASAAMGAGRTNEVSAAAAGALAVALVLGVASAGVMASLPLVLLDLGQNPEIVHLSASYIHALLPSYVATLLFATVQFLLIVTGEFRWLTPIILAGVVVKLTMNYVLAFGTAGAPGLGLAGIGLSAVIANWFMVSLAGIVLIGSQKTRTVLLRFVGLREVAQFAGAVFSTGLPTGVILFTETTLFASATLLVGRFGPVQLAAHGIVLLSLNIALMVPVGISQAAVSHVAYLAGTRSYQSIKQAADAAVAIGATAGALILIAFALAPRAIVGALLWQRSAETMDLVVDAAVPLVRIAAVVQLLAGLVIVEAGILRGLQDATYSIWIIAFCYWGAGIGTAWLIGIEWQYGSVGVWTGIMTGFLVSFATLQFRYRRCMSSHDLNLSRQAVR